MRRILVVLATGGLVLTTGLLPAAAGTSATGDYLTPFRQDGARFSGGSFSGGSYAGQATDANGCVAHPVAGAPAGNPDAFNCLPAGASMVQLADGRILYWDALEGTENLVLGSTNSTVTDGGRLTVNDESRLLTLGPPGPSWAAPAHLVGGAQSLGSSEDLPLPAPLAATHYTYNDAGLFCSDQVVLSDGSVLDVGGTDYYSEPSVPGTNKGVIELEGIRNTRIFSIKANDWVQGAPMNYGRWYPSLVTLGNGDVFVASGVTKLIKPVYLPSGGQNSQTAGSGTNVKQTETYNPATNVWTANGAAAERSLPLFPRLHLLPNGHVFYDAAGQAFNPAGQSYDEALWSIAGSYDPASKAWQNLGIPGLGAAGVNPVTVGFRGSTFSAALQLRPDSAGHYLSASFLTAGGVLLPSPGSYVPVADSRIDTVSTSGTSDQLTTVGTGPLSRGRWYSTAVPLPDGTVYAVNGADVDEVVTPGLESPLLGAELFTPTIDRSGNYTGGNWSSAGTVARKRTYHNNAILLPDGRVLIGGNAPIPSLYNQTNDGVDLPGRPGTNNHHDASFQIYEPPYIHQPRPQVTSVHQVGGDLVVATPDAATIASVVLMRNTAQTHLVDGDARTVELPIVSRGNGVVVAALPASADVLPNGPYLLFANQNRTNPKDAAPGHVIPSIGQQVFVEATSALQVITVRTAGASAPTAAAAQPGAVHFAAGGGRAGLVQPAAGATGSGQPHTTSVALASDRRLAVARPFARLREGIGWLVAALVVVGVGLTGLRANRRAPSFCAQVGERPR